MSPDQEKLNQRVAEEIHYKGIPSKSGKWEVIGPVSFEGFTLNGYRPMKGQLYACPDSNYQGPGIAIVRADKQIYAYLPYSGFMLYTEKERYVDDGTPDDGTLITSLQSVLEAAKNRVMKAQSLAKSNQKPARSPSEQAVDEASIMFGALQTLKKSGYVLTFENPTRLVKTLPDRWVVITPAKRQMTLTVLRRFSTEIPSPITPEFESLQVSLFKEGEKLFVVDYKNVDAVVKFVQNFETVVLPEVKSLSQKTISVTVLNIRGQHYMAESIKGTSFSVAMCFLIPEYGELYADYVEDEFKVKPSLVTIKGSAVDALYADEGQVPSAHRGQPRYCVRYNN